MIGVPLGVMISVFGDSTVEYAEYGAHVPPDAIVDFRVNGRPSPKRVSLENNVVRIDLRGLKMTTKVSLAIWY